MTGNNGWGSERVEDGKDNVKAEEKEQKQRREKRVLHPSDSAALASTRLCPRVTPASRHCAHDVSHHTEADSHGRVRPRTDALMQLLDRCRTKCSRSSCCLALLIPHRAQVSLWHAARMDVLGCQKAGLKHGGAARPTICWRLVQLCCISLKKKRNYLMYLK